MKYAFPGKSQVRGFSERRYTSAGKEHFVFKSVYGVIELFFRELIRPHGRSFDSGRQTTLAVFENSTVVYGFNPVWGKSGLM